MRRIDFADSFRAEADEIAIYIELQFGETAKNRFIDDLGAFCSSIAFFPRLGRVSHGYDTQLQGVIFGVNWVFFEFDDDRV
ncbi:MAG: type II toxin-antitoxin system RelE/ParE family toxin, partial [Methylocystis sp.]|nr:type II toxin-antitoxin system RelE/ParE family toxin [Methylocystis sp.]